MLVTVSRTAAPRGHNALLNPYWFQLIGTLIYLLFWSIISLLVVFQCFVYSAKWRTTKLKLFLNHCVLIYLGALTILLYDLTLLAGWKLHWTKSIQLDRSEKTLISYPEIIPAGESYIWVIYCNNSGFLIRESAYLKKYGNCKGSRIAAVWEMIAGDYKLFFNYISPLCLSNFLKIYFILIYFVFFFKFVFRHPPPYPRFTNTRMLTTNQTNCFKISLNYYSTEPQSKEKHFEEFAQRLPCSGVATSDNV